MFAGIRSFMSSSYHVLKNNARRILTRPPKMKFFYGRYYKHMDVVENRILFESFHGSTVSDSPLFILKELLSRPDAGKFEIFYSSNTNDLAAHRKFIEANNLPVTLVPVSSYKYLKVLATAKYLVNNSSFPVYFIKKENQVYLQTWHGTPLKTLGKQMRMGIESMYNVQHNFLQADYLMHPNEFTKEAIMRDYNLNTLFTGKVALSGYPRNSIFLDREAAKNVREKLGLENKTVYAYMPTWRGTSNHAIQYNSYAREISEMMTYLDKNLTDDEMLFVNFHPILHGAVKLDQYKHITSFPADVNNYEFLNACDALITDYSSVFFDFSVTRKPVILFMYDYDDYMRDRGMYFDIKKLPFVKVYDIKELSDWLSSKKILNEKYDDDSYCEEFLKYDSPDAPAKMLDLLLYGKEDGLDIEDYSANKEPERRVVHPYRIKNKYDFETVSRFARKNDIVLLEKKWFSKSLSARLYDEYNDSFDYVIITNTTPRTYTEEVLSKLGNKKIRERLAKRELKRTFPRLNVTWPYTEDFCIPEYGCSVNQTVPVVLDATLESNGKSIKISLKDRTDITLSRFMLVSKKGNIEYAREVTGKEADEGIITEDFLDIKEHLNMNTRYDLACTFEDRDGLRKTGFFQDSRFRKINERNLSVHSEKGLYLEPVIVHELGSREHMISGYQEGDAAIVPHSITKTGRRGFSVFTCDPDKVINDYIHADITGIKSYPDKCIVSFRLRKVRGLSVKNVVLRYRSAVSYDAEADYTVRETGSYYRIRAVLDFSKMNLRELYWDLRITTMFYGVENEIKVKFRNNLWKYRFYLTNRQYSADEGHMTFPYYTKGGYLAFMYRQDSPYDGSRTIRNELLASVCYIFTKHHLKKKHIWLVYEKFCSMAQDNGYYFFKYCMEKLPEDEKKNIYYVIDKKAPDYRKIEKYKDHVIDFMSFRHVLYLLGATMYVGSDSRTHLYAWRCKTSMIRSKMNQRPIFFLQHGVTALKRDANLFGKHGSSPMTYYATTSKFEQDIIIKYFDYSETHAPIVGFARWDVLEDKSDPSDRFILIMPTWRSWLEEVSDEDFLNSDYYRNYSSLLESPELENILEKENTRIIFYIHPKFAGYLKNFKINSSRVTLIKFGEKPLNEIMMRCSALITDYSSVCWDVYYQKKPVIFYQFDLDKYNTAHGSYVDMEHDLFGRRAVTQSELLDKIKECIDSGFKMLPKDYADHKNYFEYIDDKNSERTYKLLRSRGY